MNYVNMFALYTNQIMTNDQGFTFSESNVTNLCKR